MERKSVIFLVVATLLQVFPNYTSGMKNVIYAVNAGGDFHIDIFGVHYQKDPLENEGVASDYGMRLHGIGRVDQSDEMLYRTERYSTQSFGYEIPIKNDGQYVLVLKFCEVYFGSSGAKVFDVVLNEKHTIVPELDIYSQVGLGVAHDEIIPFKVAKNGQKLIVDGSESEIKKGKISLQFVKGSFDNPKINAFYVVKGTVDDVPKLPEIAKSDDAELFDEEDEEMETLDLDHGDSESYDRVFSSFNKKSSYRRQLAQRDPWDDETLFTVYMPVVGAFGASCFAILLAFVFMK